MSSKAGLKTQSLHKI